MKNISLNLIGALLLVYGASFLWPGVKGGEISSIIIGLLCLIGSIGIILKKSWSQFPVYIISAISILGIDLIALALIGSKAWHSIPIGIEIKWEWLYGNNVGKLVAVITLIAFNVLWIACSLSVRNYFMKIRSET